MKRRKKKQQKNDFTCKKSSELYIYVHWKCCFRCFWMESQSIALIHIVIWCVHFDFITLQVKSHLQNEEIHGEASIELMQIKCICLLSLIVRRGRRRRGHHMVWHDMTWHGNIFVARLINPLYRDEVRGNQRVHLFQSHYYRYFVYLTDIIIFRNKCNPYLCVSS